MMYLRKIVLEDVDWIHVAQGRNQRLALVNTELVHHFIMK